MATALVDMAGTVAAMIETVGMVEVTVMEAAEEAAAMTEETEAAGTAETAEAVEADPRAPLERDTTLERTVAMITQGAETAERGRGTARARHKGKTTGTGRTDFVPPPPPFPLA